NVFALDASTGALSANGALDYETTMSYTLRVSVSDGSLSTDASITVNVTNVNDAPVMADQSFSVAEDAGSRTVIGTIAASDAEMDRLTFTIVSGNTGNVFALDASTGVLSTAGALDYETTMSYTLRVSVSDGSLSTDASITVNVVDVPGERDEAKDMTTLATAGNDAPTGIWSDGATLWVADLDDAKIYAYNLADGVRQAAKDINTLRAAGNSNPFGLWSDRTTLWVSDLGIYDADAERYTQDPKIYAYRLSDGMRQAEKDLNSLLAARNDVPVGLWSNGTTLWVNNDGGNLSKTYAYRLSDGMRQAAKDINTLRAAGNSNPRDLWSDGTTLWIIDGGYTDGSTDGDIKNLKIYAYRLSDGMRQAEKDLNSLLAAGNSNPVGLWSDGATLWVSDYEDARIYAYRLPK
ncbi:MAG: cadherin repeat domain-containing protein, partial [Ekhidna sp.]|nr:cadherin repeat domain-containing protein [Ekhidna sp.]